MIHLCNELSEGAATVKTAFVAPHHNEQERKSSMNTLSKTLVAATLAVSYGFAAAAGTPGV